MVNTVVLDYLKKHSKKYKTEDLKRKVISSGYSEEEVDEALGVLGLRIEEVEIPEPPALPKPLVEKAKPLEVKIPEETVNSKWLQIGGISGIIFLVFIVLSTVLGMMIKPSFLSPFSSIFTFILFLSYILFLYGFAILGKKYSNKLVKIASWSFIILAILFIVLQIFLMIFPEIIVDVFFSSLKETTTLSSLDFAAIYSQLLGGLFKILLIFILIAFLSLILNILLGIGLLKLKDEVEKAKIAGILHILGGVLLIILIGAPILFVAFIFDIVLLLKESKKG